MKYCPVCNEKYDDGLSFCIRDGETLREDSTAIIGSDAFKTVTDNVSSVVDTNGLKTNSMNLTDPLQDLLVAKPKSPYSTTPPDSHLPPTISNDLTELPIELQQPISKPESVADNYSSAPLTSKSLREELPPTSAANIEAFGVDVGNVSGQNITSPALAFGPVPVFDPAKTPQKRKSISGVWFLIPILGLFFFALIGAAGIGVYIFWDEIWPKHNANTNENTNINGASNTDTDANDNRDSDANTGATSNNNTSPDLPASATEAMRYWLEVLKSKDSAMVRLAQETMTLESGQSFKFNFVPQSDGYLYIVGSGYGEASTTFLTAKPISQLGVTTNRIEKGAEYILPRGNGNWFTLDENVGIEKYIIVFAPVGLTAPSFFTAEAGRLLNTTEEKELEEFLEKHKANAPTLSVNEAVKNEPFISIKASKLTNDTPLVFNITIDHR